MAAIATNPAPASPRAASRLPPPAAVLRLSHGGGGVDPAGGVLSRVPYKSLCRLMCVCRRWRRVISDPDHRRLLDDAIAGFFNYQSFINVSGRGRPFVDALLPFLLMFDDLELLDSCNGLLLCRCCRLSDYRRFDYLVVNRATEQWVVLPESARPDKKQIAYWGFDPAVSSSNFHVFELVEDNAMDVDGDHDGNIDAVEIYSSETGVWSHKDNGWGSIIRVLNTASVFFNNSLHLAANLERVVAAVDVEGNTWRTIPMPQNVVGGFIDLHRGCLCFVNNTRDDPYIVSVWVLEDYSSEQWTLKHTVSHLHLFAYEQTMFGMDYEVISICPEGNIIFLVLPRHKILLSYEMDSGEVRLICNLECKYRLPYLPYVPMYSESLADGH